MRCPPYISLYLPISPYISLQAEIDALPADVRVLTITAGSGFYDEELTASLARPMPELQELQLVDVAFERVILTEVRVRANPNPHPDPNPNPNPDPDPNLNPNPRTRLSDCASSPKSF